MVEMNVKFVAQDSLISERRGPCPVSWASNKAGRKRGSYASLYESEVARNRDPQ